MMPFKGTVHPQNKCCLCKSPSLAHLRMAIHSPRLSFVTEILDFVSLIFVHIIAAIFVELGGGIACIFERLTSLCDTKWKALFSSQRFASLARQFL